MTLTPDDLAKIDELLIKHKSEFYDRIEPILAEVQASRQERQIQSAKIFDHEHRLTKIEQKLSD